MRPENTDQNAGSCLCPGCPTYNGCMKEKGQALFCSRGDTECDPSPKGCICGECPVWASYDLSDYYYCMNGAAG
jgi:hypothetical protein